MTNYLYYKKIIYKFKNSWYQFYNVLYSYVIRRIMNIFLYSHIACKPIISASADAYTCIHLDVHVHVSKKHIRGCLHIFWACLEESLNTCMYRSEMNNKDAMYNYI